MPRTYLFVPPEERIEVQSLGAHWDNDTKRWYLEPDQPTSNFARWLPGANELEEPEDDTFTIESNLVYVAATTASC